MDVSRPEDAARLEAVWQLAARQLGFREAMEGVQTGDFDPLEGGTFTVLDTDPDGSRLTALKSGLAKLAERRYDLDPIEQDEVYQAAYLQSSRQRLPGRPEGRARLNFLENRRQRQESIAELDRLKEAVAWFGQETGAYERMWRPELAAADKPVLSSLETASAPASSEPGLGFGIDR